MTTRQSRISELYAAAQARVGGTQPLWSRTGKELFYFRPDGMLMSAAIDTGRASKPGVARELFPFGELDCRLGK